jgi:DNA-binding response OmpR family regulator
MKKVLVLEDESSIRSFIVINLRRAGYEVVEAETGEEALEKLEFHRDTRVALLDVMLPGIDGFEVCRRIRASNSNIGIIMLTARAQEMDKVTGLMTGADDYVTKPFSPAELTARVDALMRRSGYEPIEAETGMEALEKWKVNPDICLALLDVMLPDIDGFEVCRRIRASGSKMGIIMLTAKNQEIDKVTGLMTGADDYVTKPFSPAELTARVDALMRRSGGNEVTEGEIRQDPFLLNTRNRTLEKNGQRIKLTQVEYAIIKMFMENPGKALSREEILDMVWGRDYFGELKIVDVNIRRLRLKIEDNPTNPTYITTVWGYGYKWGF